MNGVQGPSRLLNHSRFPNGRAHGFAAPLRVALGLWPKCPQGTRFPSRLAGVWGRLPVAQSSRRALAAPTARFAPHLRVALRCAQQPTGLTLPSGAPSPVPQHKKASVASARRAQETRLAQPLPEYQRKRRGHPLPGGAAPLLFKKHYHWKDPRFSRPFGRSQRSTGFAAGSAAVLPLLPASSRVSCSLRSLATLDGLCRRKRWRPPASSCIKPRFSRPFGRSQRSTGFAAGSAAVLRLFLHQAAFLASRLLNHSRFPDGRAHGFAVLANIGVLRAGRAQPLYLLTPAGRFALRATAHRADASLRCAPGRFATSGGKCPQGTRFPSRLRSLATLTAFAAAEVFGALPQTPARA